MIQARDLQPVLYHICQNETCFTSVALLLETLLHAFIYSFA